MKLYRYISEENSFGSFAPEYKLRLLEFIVHRETEKCYVIMDRYKERYILKDSGRKRFAYRTKGLAMVNYKKRTQKYIKILESQLKKATYCLGEAELMDRPSGLPILTYAELLGQEREKNKTFLQTS